ncbi:hypothetical protein [Candidatus Mycolicibacterium alkanivorans]|uniref:Transposase n=1 Tax=Candidatus Mycolicibacterium alkanivorans TaxID=2954114 RepID=A0ABS9YV43_9MYCO|nr:hypothetical protein [Candidatus Mycolicibacterium alkanivorans]MCI4674978.1 hypothetical protein [Candidatus Mycolicibacterium alkanivorans]
MAQDREAREGRGELTRDDLEELKRLRSENIELRMERDVLKRSVVLWLSGSSVSILVGGRRRGQLSGLAAAV